YLIENGCADFAAVGRGMLADPAFANHVITGEPVNACRGCGDHGGRCLWFTDHTKCPANRKS
ncbi:MAG TPA: NADH:flavin oxidoreductase, partial [Negativicutes bacterium]|nr:NADH:flavin oxidoreductase [Negativicutes bacterium]